MTTTKHDRLRVDLERSWWSFAGPHGGYLASHLLQAAAAATDRPPRSLQVQFDTAPAEGPAEVAAVVEREGRSATLATAVLRSSGVPAARATVLFGPGRPGPSEQSLDHPDAEAPEELTRLEMPPDFVPFAQHLEYRPAAGTTAFGGARPELTAWVRFLDGRPIDSVAATILVDAMQPALYGSLAAFVPVPTVDMSVQYLDPVAEGWVLLRIVTRSARDGWCVDDSEVWAADGRLLATARQTRIVLGAPA